MAKEFVFRRRESPKYTANLVRKMRNAMTPEEVILWERIRKKEIEGARFRRQRPIGRYIVDFYCAETGLVIEVDGAVHRGRDQYDKYRDSFLSAEGYTVLRFSNDEIHNCLDDVVEKIRLKIIKNKGE